MDRYGVTKNPRIIPDNINPPKNTPPPTYGFKNDIPIPKNENTKNNTLKAILKINEFIIINPI